MSSLATRANQLLASALLALQSATTTDAVDQFFRDYLSKKGAVKQLRNELKTLPADEKRTAGGALHALQNDLEAAYATHKKAIADAALTAKLAAEWLDPTQDMPAVLGSIHPLSQMQQRVEQIFERMGYAVADGPELETEWYNFDALNVPEHHPARDMQDTFWINKDSDDPHKNHVLRTQTSNAQIRMMQAHGAPLRMICPGRVYRSEATDATHDSVFYQVEGLVIDKGIGLPHLKGTIEHMLRELFESDVKVRLRPGYFPFVEPGMEVDMWWEFIDKNGDKQGKWLEFMGAGMVHPNVLRAGGIDPDEYTGFAFGFGLTRLVMMRHGIEDIRHLFGTKPRFLAQF